MNSNFEKKILHFESKKLIFGARGEFVWTEIWTIESKRKIWENKFLEIRKSELFGGNVTFRRKLNLMNFQNNKEKRVNMNRFWTKGMWS